MRRSLFLAAPIALLALLGACSFVENLDDYATGAPDAADSGHGDTHVDSVADSGDTKDSVADSTIDSTVDSTIDDTGVDSSVDADTGDVVVDSSPVDSTADTAPVDAGAYRHTVTIDGTNDFDASKEKFSTTTAGFDAYVTWDASALYVGYAGADFGSTLATDKKWLLVYLDADPGAATGATKSEQYALQQQLLPSGFGAEAYFAIKTDGSYSQFKTYSAGTWSPAAMSGVTFKLTPTSSYVELRIPFTALGAAPTKVGVLSFMLNEDTTAGEWTWAGLYSGSFTDGKSLSTTPLTIKDYLQIDLTSPRSPNDPANKVGP